MVLNLKNRNKEEIQTLHDLESLEMQLAQCTDIPNFEIICQIIEKVIASKEKQLEKIISTQTSEACLRNRAIENIDSEKPSKFFCNLTKECPPQDSSHLL